MSKQKKETRPPQHQEQQPGREGPMHPKPKERGREYKGAEKLKGKVALITGGDSGIGRAVAIHFAKEGADVAFVYLNEHEDAEKTKRMVEDEGVRCISIAGDVTNAGFCQEAVSRTVEELGQLDVLVNHAGEQHHRSHQHPLEDMPLDEMERTFRTNIFAFFYMAKAAMPHLREGSTIINTTSITAYKGSPHLLDYSATKGAIVSFTRSLSQALVKQGIRVNAVAPGPVWTPLIPASFPEEEVSKFGGTYPMGRPAEPEEIAPSYVFLASEDSSYMSGQVLHPNGGVIVES